MRGSRLLIAAGVLALSACGAGEDLKARWLVLPDPPQEVTTVGPGTAEITGLDIDNMSLDVTVLEAPVEDVTEGFDQALTFREGKAELEFVTGSGTVPITVEIEDRYFSDANGDGFQDAMIVLDQHVTGADTTPTTSDEPSTAVMFLTYSEENIGQSFYVPTGPLEHVSAIEGGFSMTTTSDGFSDTIEVGMPEGVPVRIDEHGGALHCATSIEEIDAALTQRPVKLDAVNAFPGLSEIAGYDEFALFPLPDRTANPEIYGEYERMVFLLDGGDVTRWTDYRCAWVASSEL